MIDQKILLLLVCWLTIVNAQLQFNIEFQIDNHTRSQSIYLFDLKTFEHVQDVFLNSTQSSFSLKRNHHHDQNGLIYLEYRKANELKCNGENYQLELVLINRKASNSVIRLNVTIYDYKAKLEECYKLIDNRLNIEYIFKLSNDSDYGMIKDDMSSNGIIAIIRIDSSLANLTSRNELLINMIHYEDRYLDLENKYFMLKKFLPNFYMLCLTDNTRYLFEIVNDNKIEIELGLTLNKVMIAVKSVKFKLIIARDLEIQLVHQTKRYNSEVKIDLETTEQYGKDCDLMNKYGGVHLFNPELYVESKLFQTEQDYRVYIEKNVRFTLSYSNVDIVELDSMNGNLYVKSGNCLDREELDQFDSMLRINLTAYDMRKLFKSINISLNIRVKDLNDNEPRFSQSEYYLRLNHELILNKHKKEIVLFDEKAIDLDENSSLVYELVEATSYINSKTRSFVNLFHLKQNKVLASTKIFQREERYFSLRLLCRDNGEPDLKYTVIKINLLIESNKPAQIISADFDFNFDMLKLEATKLGSLQLNSLHNELIMFNSSSKHFKLELNSNNNLMISKSADALFDRFSFVKFENLEYNLLVFVKFSSLDKNQFGQNLYEFVYAEDHMANLTSNIIGFLETDCTMISSITIASDYAYLFKFETRNNQILVVSLGDLDYEFEASYDIKVYAVCNQMYLMSTRVRIKLIDVNDNEPQFLNPIVSNQTFYKQINSRDSLLINITRIRAVDHDKTDEFSLLKFRIKSTQFFFINESTGDLFFKVNDHLQTDKFLNYTIEITAFNDYQTELVSKYNSKTVSIRVILLIQTQQIISIGHQEIKSNSFISFNLIPDLFYEVISKCWLTIDFKQSDQIDLYHLSVHDQKLSFFKRNNYLDSSQQQFVIECQLFQLNNNKNLIGWTQLSAYRSSNLALHDYIKTSELHYDLNRLDLSDSKVLFKIDQLFDLNIPLNYFIVYSFNVDNLDFIKLNLVINRFTGELSTRISDKNWKQIVSSADLLVVNIDISLLHNRNEQKSTIRVYLHLSNSPKSSLLSELKTQLDQIQSRLANNLVRIGVNDLKVNTYFVHINRANEYAESKLNFTIQKVLKLDLNNNNDIELFDSRLLTIREHLSDGYYDTSLVLDLDHLRLDDEFEIYYQINLKMCPVVSDDLEIGLSFDLSQECEIVALNLAVEINLNLSEFKFEYESYSLRFAWSNTSANVALLDLKSFLTNSSYLNFKKSNFVKFRTDSDLVNLNEQNGLLYLSTNYLLNQLEFNASLIEISSDKTISTTKIRIEFYQNHQVNLIVQLDDENVSEKIVVASLNQTASIKCDVICLSLSQHICNSIFETENSMLILNQYETRKYLSLLKQERKRVRRVEILIKSNKNDLVKVNLDLEIKTLKEIQQPTFEFSQQFVYLVESNEKKASFLIETKNETETHIEMTRVKNLITNNEVLALDCQFKSVNKSNFMLKLDDVMSLEMNQIYSFDFNVTHLETSYFSSLFVVRLNQLTLDSIITQKQFVSLVCDDSTSKQMVMNFSREKEDNPTSVFTQKIYLISKYSRLNVKYFKIYGAGLYLVNTKYNCDKVFSSTSSINILKFYIDKISLRIKKAIQIELHLEVLRKQRTSLTKYQHKIEMLKTDLLTHRNHELDDIIIYEFNLTRGDYEFSIDYSNLNLPFEIDKFNGKLKYLPSEDNFEFDRNGEKYFTFEIQIASASNSIDLFKFEFLLIDNDPIVLENDDSLNAKFYIDSSFISKKLIGHIDLISLIESSYLKEFFQHNKHNLNFRIQDKDTFFHVDKHNGLLYLKNSIESLEFDACSFSLKVNGTIGHKTALISINILVVANKLINFELDINHNIDFYLNSTNRKLDTFKLTSVITNLDSHVVRFKNLTDLSEICQLSWLNGEIYCSTEKFNQLNLKKLTLSILVIFKTKNENLFVRHVKVNMINFESYLNNMKSLFYSMIDTNSQINLSLALQQKTTTTIRDNINQRLNELGFKIDLINHRFIFSPDQTNSSSRISSYFNLDQFSSQLEQYRLVDESIILEDTIQVIELSEENNFKIFKTVNLKLTIETSPQIPCGFKHTFVSNIDLNNLTSNSALITIININEIFRNQENVDYFLSEENLSVLTDYSLTESISLDNQLKVYLNKSTGDLMIDKSNIYYASSFHFYLIAKYANNAQRFEQISYEVNFYFGFRTNLTTRLLNDLYESSLEFQIVLDTATLNDTFVLDLNDLLFNQAYLIARFDLNLTSTTMQKHLPFEIDKFNKSLTYIKQHERVHSLAYELIITMNNDFDFMIKFILKNNERQALVFDNHLYTVEISFHDFNNLNKAVLERVQANYLINNDSSKKAQNILYQFVDQDLVSSMSASFKRNLRKLIKLDPYIGEIELVRKSWSLFLDYCSQMNQFESNHIAVLYTISAIDKETTLEAKSVLKLVIKCDQLKETFQFEKSSYVISINEDTKVGSFITRINTKKTSLSSSIKLNYYFCSLKMNSALLNPFSLSQKTGDVYLNNQPIKKANFSFEICANIENNFMSKTIRTNLDILVRSELKFEFDAFNSNADNDFEIEIPLVNLDEKKSFKLFQLSTLHASKHLVYDFTTQDSDLLQLNSTNGWLSFNIDGRSHFKNDKFNFKAILSDHKLKRELNFKLSFLHFNVTNNFIIELNYPYQRIFDIKALFRKNYNFIVIEPNQYVSYNSTEGVLVVNSYASNRVFQCDLKLISIDSDIKLGVVQINPLSQLKYKKVITINELFISKYSQLNTIVYNLNDISDRIEELISESALFSLSSNSQAVYLSGDLLSLHSEKITLSLITKYQFIKLNIHLIENLYESLSFSKFSYYFKYSLSTKNDFYVGSVDLNLNKEIFLKLLAQQFKLNSFKLNETVCLQTRSSNEAFYLQNKIDIYFNASAYDFSCSLYRMVIQAELDFRNISAYVFVELDNLVGFKQSNKSNTYSTQSIILNNTNEINLNNLFQYVVPIQSVNVLYSASLILDESENNKHIEYNFNRLNGLLKVYFDQNVNHKAYMFKINVLIQSENDYFLFQQFKLNVIQKSNQILFKEQLINCELSYLQQNRLFNDRLVFLDLNKYLIKSNQDNLNLSLARSPIKELLELDPLDNMVYFNSNSMLMNKRYYFNLSQLIEINLCQLSTCQTLIVHFKLNILKQDARNLVIEYYNLLQNTIWVKTNSVFKNVNLIKLKNFNSNYYSVVNNLTNIVMLDKTNNVMSIKSTDLRDLFSLDGEQFKVVVAYDTIKPIMFSINYIENSNRILSSDLSLDVFYNGEVADQSIYLAEFIQNSFGCELWEKDSITNEKIEFLHSSCKLVINFNSTEYSSSQQINLQIRAFDKESISKSVFFLVKLNLIKIDFDPKKSILIKSSNRQKVNSLNKNLKLKLNSYIVDELQTESQVLLIRTLDEFNNNLVNKLLKLLDNTYGVGNYEIINPSKAKSCQSKLIFESANSEYYYDLSKLQFNYKSLIQTSQYMLISPDLLRQVELNNNKANIMVSEVINFPNLKNLMLDWSDLEIINRIWVTFMFKLESKSSFLFSLSALSTKFNFYTNDSILQISYLESLIVFNKRIELNKWYQFEFSMKSKEINIKIKKYAQNEDYLKCDDSTLEIQSKEILKFDNLNFDNISIGSESYSDKFSLADFRLNEYELFKHNKYLNTLISDKHFLCPSNDSSQIYSSNCKLAIGIFKSYLNGNIAKVQLRKRINNKPTTNLFDLSVKFKPKINNNSLNQLKEITLLQSLNSILILNFQNSTKLEFYEFGRLIGWIDIALQSNTTFHLRIHKTQDGLFKFLLNDAEKIYVDKSHFKNDLTNSVYVEINSRVSHPSNNSFILFEEIRINNEKVPLYDGFSTSYETKFVLTGSNDLNCCYFSSHIEKNAIGMKESATNNEDSLFNSIIIATTLMSLTVLLGIFILIFSYSNGKLRSANIDRIISEKASKFNSRNKLELSINSEQNSSDHSPNLSFAQNTPSALMHSKNLDSISSDSSKQYITPLSNEKQKQIFQNSQFDFGLLNWKPTFDEFKFVIKEFQEFPCNTNTLLDQNRIYHEAENQIDIYLRQDNFEISSDLIDKQTFV